MPNITIKGLTVKKKIMLAEVHLSDKLVKFVFNQTSERDSHTEYYLNNNLVAKVPHNQLVVFSTYTNETKEDQR